MIHILEVDFSLIATDKNFPKIKEGYADESGMVGLPKPDCQTDLYYQMQATGLMHPIAAYDDDKNLLGFLLLICNILPHYGVKIATAESFYVLKEYRCTGAGKKLLRAAEDLAVELGAKGVLISAPTGSRLAEVMPRSGYNESNRIFFKGLP